MGMYTALVLDARLREDVPEEVINVLRYMVEEGHPIPRRPDHPLFGDTRWSWMLRGDSAYFPIERKPLLYRPFYGPSEKPLLLSVGCSFKNYCDEIRLFLNWISPYVEEAIGYSMYEEDTGITPIVMGWYA